MTKPRNISNKEFRAIKQLLKRATDIINVLDLDNFMRKINSDPILKVDIVEGRWRKLAEITRKHQYQLQRISIKKEEKKDDK